MIICADDFGLRADIDAAILELCEGERLSAVSCMTALARCSPALLNGLRPFRQKIDVGLHLCLTHETEPIEASLVADRGGSKPREFRGLLLDALTGRLDPRALGRDISLQYKLFVEKSGACPDFIDGHLHAHQLPCIRQALIAFVRSLPGDSRPYIRNTRMPVSALRKLGLPWAKAAFIGFFGSRAFQEFRAAGLRTNNGFAGVYDFQDTHYAKYFPRFVESLSETNGILVVHPGNAEPWRNREFLALRDFQFQRGAINRCS